MLFFLPYQFSQAQEEKGYLRICMPNPTYGMMAYEKMQYLVARVDKVDLDGKCIDIYTPERRKFIFKKFFRVKYNRLFTIEGDTQRSVASSIRQCQFKVTRMGKENINSRNLEISRRSRFQDSIKKGSSKTVSSLIVGDGMEGTIQVDGERVTLGCRVLNTGYNVTIRLESIQREDNTLTSDSTTLGLSTTRFLSKGQQVELGSVVKNLKNDGHSINIPVGATKEKTRGSISETVYLSVD
jgi:hypothetical protein